ncbi:MULTISPECIES: PadR family transcriptional regulator [unclassified Paenibacillus]|uniref:PadR family transcriptional regulator n=1 Tax=unclassified Paenibacillus TaxID=185978 RepID=UPI001AE8C820|nr:MULTISPECIES: PadR family transcriptional regulator [unclassified Paenibacillus]MBP1157385.1 PadR family transcriptional regulator PadR [Paenibacillus sp. PvP091]MBP1171877.1 PadR family transcriptional regulator PadR [Paenibacillus sp. PvR098]MBP2438258.1 PadR family transcriptional regulator PadR [Paenibacillus sp. PvP052]
MQENSISRDFIRGNIDTIILRVLIEGDNYGYEIIKAISKNSHGKYELKEPSLYTSLKRLESQQLIESYWGDESQGGRRKYYKVTAAGIEAYKHHLAAWKTAKVLIDQLIE